MKNVKVYLSTPLIYNRDIEYAKKLVGMLKEIDLDIVSKWVIWQDPNPNLDSKEIYRRDIGAISTCDIIIADVSNLSIGVGIEIMYAHTLGKIIFCIHSGRKLSKMVLGMPGISIINYASFDDLKVKILSKIDQIMNLSPTESLIK